MAKEFLDSDRLEGMIILQKEYDEKGNPLTNFGVNYHHEGLPVSDMLEAQRRAISGSTSGGGSSSGGTISTLDESENKYNDWEKIVEGSTAAESMPLSAINSII